MSGTPINLNAARKKKQRQAARKKADENSVKFGRTKAEKEIAKANKNKLYDHLEEHKCETLPDG